MTAPIQQILLGQSVSTAVSTFLARAETARGSPLDATHIAAYTALIDGLATDNITPKLDMLHIYATQDSATALLNLVSSSYNGTLHGSPTFTAEYGFTGSDGSSTIYIDTGFNATTASSPKFIQNSAHLSLWNLTNGASTRTPMGADTSGHNTYLLVKYTDNSFYVRMNNLAELPGDGAAIGDCRGHLIGNRSASGTIEGYQNGSSVGVLGAHTSATPPNLSISVLGFNINGTITGDARQIAVSSIGASLSSTDATNFYNRLATFLESVRNPGSEATAFLARTSGLNSVHRLAYIDLINGLVADGVWTKLDALWVFATQDSTTALLNLVSSTYNATSNGSPTFTADRGFTGTNASTTVYLNSNFTPSSASSPKFTQNSAHLSIWALNNITSGFPAIGTINSPTPNETDIYVKYIDNNTYYRVNGAGATGFANGTAIGHSIATRPSSGGGVDAYKNGASVGNTSGASQSVSVRPVYLLANNLDGTANGSAHQIAMASIGSNLSSTDASNFYNRLRTFMTAVGVP